MPPPLTRPANDATNHVHRWRIEEPNGPLSAGICTVCGARREFRNWLADGDYLTNGEHRWAA
jgi:hypothetical protein